MNQVIGQTINQTLNFTVNISNSNASNTMDIEETVMAYGLAVASAIAGSVGLKKLLTAIKLPGMLGKALIASTPYFGLCTASTVNLFFSRHKDIQ